MAEPLGLEEVRRALAEDAAGRDVTTRLLGAAAAGPAAGRFVAGGEFVVAGLPVVATVLRELEPGACLDAGAAEGSWARSGDVLAVAAASGQTLLAGERVALNFLQHLSGIATVTRRAVDAVAGTGARITHTRKTTPGLRALERYAVRVGGGVENRASLADAVLWKDNHWALLGHAGRRLRDSASPRLSTGTRWPRRPHRCTWPPSVPNAVASASAIGVATHHGQPRLMLVLALTPITATM